jgi:hypothetical protein
MENIEENKEKDYKNIMDKKYFFLAGMFRSGNTLLASILNQNSDVYVSPQSPLIEYLWRCQSDDFQEAITYPNKYQKTNMIKKMIKNFYESVNKTIIIDRNKNWASPDNLAIIKKYITENPKIIFTVRPLHECIASHINIMKPFLLSMMKKYDQPQFSYNKNISENDNIAEYLLSGNDYSLHYFAHSSYVNDANKKIIHVVKYEDLVNDPSKTLRSIYDFIEIKSYSHDFNNINKIEQELTDQLGLPKDLHKVNKTLSYSVLDVSNILSETMIQKCKKMDLFYN